MFNEQQFLKINFKKIQNLDVSDTRNIGQYVNNLSKNTYKIQVTQSMFQLHISYIYTL